MGDTNKMPGADDNIQRNRLNNASKIKVDTIQKMFENYLMLVKLPNEAELRKINPTQHNETKRAFYGAIAQLLIVQRYQIAEVESDEMSAAELEKLWCECEDFWQIQK